MGDTMDWQAEIDEMHALFEAWFLGEVDDIDRVHEALGPDFTLVGPDGEVRDRAEVIRMIEDGRAHTEQLTIRVSDHRLLAANDQMLVAEYIEHHDLADRSNHRRSTVVFDVVEGASNDLRWRRVHETWLPDDHT